MGSGATPDAPTFPDIDPASIDANVIFKWVNSGTPGTSNEIWSSDVDQNGAASPYTLLQTVGGGVNQIHDLTLAVGIIRLYKVRACSGGNCSAFTSPVGVSDVYVSQQAGAVTYPIIIAFGLLEFDIATTITLPNLRTANSDFITGGNGQITTISCAALTTVGSGGGGSIGFNFCPSLISASLPSLLTVAGNVDCDTSPAMTTWNAPNLIISNGALIDFTGNAMNAASINQILHRGVVSAVTTCGFELTGGTNAAPSGQGIADKATLIGAGNTVNTN